ncbi:homeobox protein engrailed-1-like isoform X4 [Felis catus]|uniref:homeobox protein engrailed-1-like isoform X4 n=1 Tax=Felis catus TaxID=9685 RepID=UPI001D1A00B8|nr:homeobox protein engrailed-1-like isoform X4 [Felis catus]
MGSRSAPGCPGNQARSPVGRAGTGAGPSRPPAATRMLHAPHPPRLVPTPPPPPPLPPRPRPLPAHLQALLLALDRRGRTASQNAPPESGAQVPVSFEDVPVYFIKTGWKLLDLSQRIPSTRECCWRTTAIWCHWMQGSQRSSGIVSRCHMSQQPPDLPAGQGITPLSGWPQSPPAWGSPCPPGPHASKVHASRVHGGAHVAAQPRGPAGGGGRGAGGQLRGAGGLVRPEDPAALSGQPLWWW